MKRLIILICFLLFACRSDAFFGVHVASGGASSGTEYVETVIFDTDGVIYTSWIQLGAGDKYLEIDDPVGSPDDAASYIYKTDSDGTQGFIGFPAYSSSSTQKIVLHFRGRAVSGDVLVRPRLLINGSSYVGTDLPMTASYADYTWELTENPDTSSAWVEADVEGTGSNPIQEVGFEARGMSAGEEVRITQAYETVHYTSQ